MRSLWFKKVYVDPILTGEKVDTVRMKPVKGLKVGELVGAHVGPRPAFATLRITGIVDVPMHGIETSRRESIANIYGGTITDETVLTVITFVLVDE